MVGATTGAFGQAQVEYTNTDFGAFDEPVFSSPGVPADGAQYRNMLYFSTGGAFQAQGQSFDFNGGPGYFVGGTLTLTGVAKGTTVTLEVRAWDNTTGATWELATYRGQSDPFSYATPAEGGPPPGYMLNMQSFTMVPEPSTYALLGLGVGALALFRRRKV